MAVMVLDRGLAASILSMREQNGEDRLREEVWDGVTFIMPEADNEHDGIASFFHGVFWTVFGLNPDYALHFRVNISDRERNWKQNYRTPDMALFSTHGPAKDCGKFWCGGPEVALEVVSPDDRSRDKLDFYAKVGTREVVVVDRDPFQIELYRLRRGRLVSVGIIKPGDGRKLASQVVPFEYQLIRSRPRPKVKIICAATGREWAK
jgi:Uma2 family endonuclease